MTCWRAMCAALLAAPPEHAEVIRNAARKALEQPVGNEPPAGTTFDRDTQTWTIYGQQFSDLEMRKFLNGLPWTHVKGSQVTDEIWLMLNGAMVPKDAWYRLTCDKKDRLCVAERRVLAEVGQ